MAYFCSALQLQDLENGIVVIVMHCDRYLVLGDEVVLGRGWDFVVGTIRDGCTRLGDGVL